MLTLYSSLTSPYGRKVRMVIDILGLTDEVRVRHANTLDADDPLRKANPLGKIPALELEGGATLFDSRVIVEFLEAMHGTGAIIPGDPERRFGELTLAALAEGINDALLLITYEGRFREPEQASQVWLDHQYGKVRRGLTEVCRRLDEYRDPGVAALTLACALGYADWRKQLDWRAEFPPLAAWMEAFARSQPAWERTAAPAE
ncbi:glutathione S-transferase N-terminal domain-containing protein [Nisaea acidiphila]|uniref:Glutathione S-transferase N-terminal domain-containing protein n=1 Tax=Nisaea acidiphila TaxID=1862145 RepID=A0A9J7AXB4_9PROT|nr:glutathione S-transferase N-terminal domain-containing protein [Nisaea acidiphila]UUX50884.1 glutathione S-transferase N-terminal domain-containing protein [Nisaea acidiphila]